MEIHARLPAAVNVLDKLLAESAAAAKYIQAKSNLI